MDFTSDSEEDKASVPQKRVAPPSEAKTSPNSKRNKAGPSRKKAPVPTSKDFETDTD